MNWWLLAACAYFYAFFATVWALRVIESNHWRDALASAAFVAAWPVMFPVASVIRFVYTRVRFVHYRGNTYFRNTFNKADVDEYIRRHPHG